MMRVGTTLIRAALPDATRSRHARAAVWKMDAVEREICQRECQHDTIDREQTNNKHGAGRIGQHPDIMQPHTDGRPVVLHLLSMCCCGKLIIFPCRSWRRWRRC